MSILQRNVQRVTKSAPSPASDRTDGRDAAGRFVAGNAVGDRFKPGNSAGLIHGGRRLQLGCGTPLDESRRVELRDGVLADLGGPDEVSVVLGALVEDFASAVLLRETAWSHIAAVGPLTRAGRRRAVVGLYFLASGRVERLAAQIGLSRQSRPVSPGTPMAALKHVLEHGLPEDDGE